MTAKVVPPAERLLHDLGITKPGEIDVEVIACAVGAAVRYRRLGVGDARIVGLGDRAIITVDDRASRVRQRFSVAHDQIIEPERRLAVVHEVAQEQVGEFVGRVFVLKLGDIEQVATGRFGVADIRLPAADDPTFHEIYRQLSSTAPARVGPKHGTLHWLALDYRASVEWQAKSARTRENQDRYIQLIIDEHGHRTVTGVRPFMIYKMRDAYAETPGKANVWLSVFGSLMRHAIKLGLIDKNPANEVPVLKTGEHEPWPVDLLRVCLDEATPMTRLAIITGLCSGQRIGDCIRMQYGWITAGIMEFTQEKVRKGGVTKDVAVPMHPLWTEELAKLPRKSVTLLYERTGAPFKTTAAIQERLRTLMDKEPVREVLEDLIARETIKEGATFTFHGLRKNACCYLLETGLNDSEVGSILGMSPEIVRHYGKRTRALMVARGAADRLTGGKIIGLSGAKVAVATAKNG